MSCVKNVRTQLFFVKQSCASTMEDGQKITKHFLGEHNLITPEQQFLSIILCFYVFKLAVGIAFLCENAVEAIQISMIWNLNGF